MPCFRTRVTTYETIIRFSYNNTTYNRMIVVEKSWSLSVFVNQMPNLFCFYHCNPIKKFYSFNSLCSPNITKLLCTWNEHLVYYFKPSYWSFGGKLFSCWNEIRKLIKLWMYSHDLSALILNTEWIKGLTKHFWEQIPVTHLHFY